jgi:4-amino-4-deoxy-L-arabinose transferase-like glycosyltransferase
VGSLDTEQPRGAVAEPGLWRGIGLVALFAAATILPFARVHIDDVDGGLYQVIARHVAEDGRLFHLRFLPDFWPRFFEHPPLYFWIQAAVIRLGSEDLLPWLGGAIGIATVVVTYLVGRHLVGARAAFLGTFILAVTEKFFRYQARPLLDPPLALAFTLSVALLVAARGRMVWLAAGGLVAGLGALVKGPPALGAPVAAALVLVVIGRREDMRRPRNWIIVAVAALLPPLAFLAIDHLLIDGIWWNGYVRGQFLASLTGERIEGVTNRYFLLTVISRTFWPGLPFLAFALFSASRSPPAPQGRAVWALVAWAAVIVGGFAVAARSSSWYVIPAYMPLALAAGVGVEGAVSRLFGERGLRQTVRLATAVGVLAFLAMPFWPARWLVPPCRFGDLPAQATALSPVGTSIRFGASPERSSTDVRVLASMLSRDTERDVRIGPDPQARVGLFEALVPGVPAGWVPIAKSGVWILATGQ